MPPIIDNLLIMGGLATTLSQWHRLQPVTGDWRFVRQSSNFVHHQAGKISLDFLMQSV
jgi:hypothetical protein